MMNFEKLLTRPRVLQQLTGLSPAAFQTLLEAFGRAYHHDAQEQRTTPRQRRPGGGRKGALPTLADKLVFLLF